MASNNPKISFPNHLGAKRRRMRSGGNVSTQTNNSPKKQQANVDLDEEKTSETSRCKGATTIPIFLKSECHRHIEQLFLLYASVDGIAVVSSRAARLP